MEVERRIVDYLVGTSFDVIPKEPLGTIRNMVLRVLGTTIAGSSAEGCTEMREFYRGMGGREEATILIHGGKIPAQNAILKTVYVTSARRQIGESYTRAIRIWRVVNSRSSFQVQSPYEGIRHSGTKTIRFLALRAARVTA